MRDNNNEYGELDFLAGLKTDTIAESTVGAGVTIDGCLIKDGATCSGGGLAPDDYWGRNLIKNSPGQIVTNGAEPQWWDDVANATITDEDTVGEGIPDIHERVFKVVTTANDVYGYQTLTFADEEVLDAGQTIISFGCWVYCASASKASIGIYGTNLGLQESAQHTGGATWEWLEVENKTLNAADTSIQIRLIVDTGTAYFTMPMLAVGPEAQPWKPRGMKHVPITLVTQLTADNQGDIAWSDTDCTANTDPLALAMELQPLLKETGHSISEFSVGHNDDLITDSVCCSARTQVGNVYNSSAIQFIRSDDGQVIRYTLAEGDADNDCFIRLWMTGYWMWE
jgi:hypothetical protein